MSDNISKDAPPTNDPVLASVSLLALAEKWEQEGDELTAEASIAASSERYAELQSSGWATLQCAKELRAVMSANAPGERPQ